MSEWTGSVLGGASMTPLKPEIDSNGDRILLYSTYFQWEVVDFPFSMNWDNRIAARDPYNRFRFGIPREKDKADFAFIQHMFASLNKNG